MPKPNFSEIICIVDRSGSMNSIKEDAIGGFNGFLAGQKKVEGEANLTLVLFDHEYLLVHNAIPLATVPDLTNNTFEPRGMTAMHDAIGRTIDDVGARLAKTPEHLRPEKVLVAILTDGQENASKDYTKAKIAGMIEHQTTKYNWEFFFLAANMDTMKEASSLNIRADNAVAFKATKAGIHQANVAMDMMVTRARTKKK
jgi:uncharacterized protein YegL